MTASKRVYEPVAAALHDTYVQAVEMYAAGRVDEAQAVYSALTGLVGEVKWAFGQDNIHFSGTTFHDAVYDMPYVYGVWHGGNGYGGGDDFMDNVERWEDLASAKESLRYREGGRDSFDYVTESGRLNKDRSGWFDTPVVGRDSYIDIYRVSYSGLEWRIGNEPYKRLLFGPRGGVREVSF